jgi:hypothetical protein
MNYRPLLLCCLLAPVAAYAQTDDKILVPGDPPLTEKLVWEYALALGSFLDASLKPADFDFFRNLLKGDWPDKSKRGGAMRFISMKHQLDAMDSRKREEALAGLRTQLVAMLEDAKKNPDATDAHYLLALYKRGKSNSADEPAPKPTKAAPNAKSDLLDRIFTPRKEDDEDLDTEGLLEKDTASVYPKVEQTGDALANALNQIAADQHYLAEGDLRRMVRYFEWSLEVPLVNSERNALRKALIQQHDSDGGRSSRAYQFLGQGVGFKIGSVYLDAILTPFDDYKRRDLQREYLPLLRREAKNGDQIARFLVDRYEEQQPPLTEGKNPLRPQVARVYVDHVVFCLNEIVGAKPEAPLIKVTPAFQRNACKQLIEAWPQLSEAKREELSKLPFDWANTVKSWPKTSEADKTQARIAWGKQFSQSFPEILPAHKQRVGAFEKAQALARAEAIKRERAEQARLAKLTPAQRAQEKLLREQLTMNLAMMQMQNQFQMQNQAMRMLSNTIQSGHETRMHIINNTSSTWDYKYVYRYR